MLNPDLLQLRPDEEYLALRDDQVHLFRGHRCVTDSRGHAEPDGRSVLEIRVDATAGFIPLWQPNMLLRYGFQDASLNRFRDPAGLKAAIRDLFARGIDGWGDAAPIRFTERQDSPDFQFVVRNADDCDASGCVLASSFFPDEGRHEFVIYPEMFTQSEQEQMETMEHELGHIFGLRHFFANVSETAWPSQLFGTDSRFSIMNYGDDSRLTDADKADLKTLYEAAWSGRLTAINGTPIHLMKPYSSNRP
jgi:hypothetical protein